MTSPPSDLQKKSAMKFVVFSPRKFIHFPIGNANFAIVIKFWSSLISICLTAFQCVLKSECQKICPKRLLFLPLRNCVLWWKKSLFANVNHFYLYQCKGPGKTDTFGRRPIFRQLKRIGHSLVHPGWILVTTDGFYTIRYPTFFSPQSSIAIFRPCLDSSP